jgi:ABC-type phosphate transport system permease subunit
VPNYLRDASYALGATQWTTNPARRAPVRAAGIMTGTILALVARDRRNRAAGGPGGSGADTSGFRTG